MQRVRRAFEGMASSSSRVSAFACDTSAAGGTCGLIGGDGVGAAASGTRAPIRSPRSTMPAGRTPCCMQASLNAATGMFLRSSCVKLGSGLGGGWLAADLPPPLLPLLVLALLLLLVLLLRLDRLLRLRLPPLLLLLLVLLLLLCFPPLLLLLLGRLSLVLPPLSEAPFLHLDLLPLLLALGLRSQSPTSHRSNPFEKLGHPSRKAARMRPLSPASAWNSASTSAHCSRRAVANNSPTASRNIALRLRTCFCEGQGSMAISTADAVASSRRARAGSCSARRICSSMKKPQSCEVSCCGMPGRQIAASRPVPLGLSPFSCGAPPVAPAPEAAVSCSFDKYPPRKFDTCAWKGVGFCPILRRKSGW
mmetsp:Transcript_127859/g.361913  ORF Transcript_127859/g.361913 Transcript_127859/m.361913 type:complete len:364 (-) Transcript_127859:779-1870(-)